MPQTGCPIVLNGAAIHASGVGRRGASRGFAEHAPRRRAGPRMHARPRPARACPPSGTWTTTEGRRMIIPSPRLIAVAAAVWAAALAASGWTVLAPLWAAAAFVVVTAVVIDAVRAWRAPPPRAART